MAALGSLFSLEQILLFVLLTARAGGLAATAPFLSGRMMPRNIRVLVVLVLALMMVPIAPTLALPNATSALVAMMATEILVGLALGFTAQLFVTIFQMAGELIGNQMGFGMARLIDPQSGASSSLMSQWFWVIAMALFLTLGGPALLLRTLSASLELVPPGFARIDGDTAHALVRFGSDAMSSALRIAAPAVGILLCTSLGLGILSRTVPQMNVFIVGFPLKITAGVVGVALSLPFVLDLARRELTVLTDRLAAILAGV